MQDDGQKNDVSKVSGKQLIEQLGYSIIDNVGVQPMLIPGDVGDDFLMVLRVQLAEGEDNIVFDKTVPLEVLLSVLSALSQLTAHHLRNINRRSIGIDLQLMNAPELLEFARKSARSSQETLDLCSAILQRGKHESRLGH
jgi:hypothetical protein